MNSTVQAPQIHGSNSLQLLELSEITENQRESFGAKAVNLGVLTRQGFRVPQGFALSLNPEQLFQTTPYTLENSTLKEALIEMCQRLSLESKIRSTDSSELFAVRSSSTEEDSLAFSYAGQFKTFLNQPLNDHLFHSVIKCVQSHQSSGLESYRRGLGSPSSLSLTSKNASFGVIIQKMVSARHSGICFTRDVLHPNSLIIEGVIGLGDTLVSGKSRPSRFVINRETLEMEHQDDFLQILPEWGIEALKRLARDSLAAEMKFGHPLDIEWASDGVETYFLQARPIPFLKTTQIREELIQKEKERLRSIAGPQGSVWTDFSIGDVLTHPSPLTVSGYHSITDTQSGLERAFRSIGFTYKIAEKKRPHTPPPIYDSICGKSFINVTEYIRRISGGLPLKAQVASGAQLRVKFDFTQGFFKILTSPFLLLWRTLSFIFHFYPTRKSFYRKFLDQALNPLKDEARRERQRNLSELSDADLCELFFRYSKKNKEELNYYHMLTDLISGVSRSFLMKGLKMVYGDQAEKKELYLNTGLPGNFNTECNLALCEVIEGRLPLVDFIENYGQRGNPDWEIAAPRWREDPTHLHQMMKQLKTSQIRGQKEFDKQKSTRLESETQFRKDLDTRWMTRLLKSYFLKELSYFQIYSPLREVTHSICFLWVELSRRVILEMASRTHAEDLLFYLNTEDLRSYFLSPHLRKKLLDSAHQKKRETTLLRSVYVPHLFSSDGAHGIETIDHPPPLDLSQKFLSGQTIFEGYVVGRARVVKSLDEAQDLRKGEILVTQFTDPAWTPLFFIAGGLVLEQGSTFSHGALVAREIGLPSLVNVPHVTRFIQTGQTLILDASRGRILL